MILCFVADFVFLERIPVELNAEGSGFTVLVPGVANVILFDLSLVIEVGIINSS